MKDILLHLALSSIGAGLGFLYAREAVRRRWPPDKFAAGLAAIVAAVTALIVVAVVTAD